MLLPIIGGAVSGVVGGVVYDRMSKYRFSKKMEKAIKPPKIGIKPIDFDKMSSEDKNKMIDDWFERFG